MLKQKSKPMSKPILGLMCLFAMAIAETGSAANLKVNPYGKFFSGEGVEVEMALIDGKNADGLQDALLKIKGAPAHEAGIDGQVMKYVAVPAGTGFNYSYTKNGQQRNRMATRNTWGDWSIFEVYLNNKTYHIYPDEKKAKDVKPEELLKQLKTN